jgi:Fis family transcriptional regulator, factor for inversion stimulation protein
MTDALPRPQPKLKDKLEALCLEMIERGILFPEAAVSFEKCFIQEMLRRNQNNLCRTADQLGIHRNTLARKVSQYQIKNG